MTVVAPETARAESQVTLDVQPPSIDVSPWYQRIQVRLILRNDGQAEVIRPRLAAFTNDSFEVHIGPASAARARPLEAVVWTAWLESLDRARVPGTVQFEASYATSGRPGTQQARASLAVKAQAASADKPVEISVQGSFDAITETHSGIGYLVVKNNLDVPVTVCRVAILLPEPKSFKEPKLVAPFDVPPRSTETRKIELEAASQVSSGKHVVLFEVAAEWDESGHHQTRTVTVDKEVSVGVFFESELLKAVGVPSFLLLPGCLFLFTMQLLLTLGVLGVNRHSKVPDLPVSSPGFWVIAVTLSGVFAWIYRLTTHTDYLVRYGARDLLNVWLLSVGTGALAYVVIGLSTLRRRRQRVPDAADPPIVTLEKMARRGLDVLRSKVRFKMNNMDLAAFMIEHVEDGQAMVWVAPGIVTTFSDNDRARALQQQLTQLLDRRSALSEIVETIRTAHDGKYATVDWDRGNSVPNPYHLKVEAIMQSDASEVIVRIQ
jgi:hypothetical protein